MTRWGSKRYRDRLTARRSNFRPKRLLVRATLLAAVLTALYVLNYVYGWVGYEQLDLFNRAPSY